MMKKISSKDAKRVLNHLNKAMEILNKNEVDGECAELYELFMDEGIASDCLSALSSIEHCINNSVSE